jgi:hypothetical protein
MEIVNNKHNGCSVASQQFLLNELLSQINGENMIVRCSPDAISCYTAICSIRVTNTCSYWAILGLPLCVIYIIRYGYKAQE